MASRGRGYKIQLRDLPNMSPGERNAALAAAVEVKGTAVVRKSGSGNVRYSDKSRAGSYNEDNCK